MRRGFPYNHNEQGLDDILGTTGEAAGRQVINRVGNNSPVRQV